MSLGRVDQEQAEFARRRNAAVMNSEYDFIELKLKDLTKRNIAGIDEVNAIPYMDGYVEKWQFNLMGGCAHFLPDENKGGAWIDRWVKTDRNMRFLASHYYDDPTARHWDIIDEKIEKEVAKINKSMVKVAHETPKEIRDIRNQIKEIDHQLAICEPSKAVLLREKRIELLDQIVENTTGESGLVAPPKETKPGNDDTGSDIVTTKGTKGLM